MSKNEEFDYDDIEFDFEKEFGVDLNALLGDEEPLPVDADMDPSTFDTEDFPAAEEEPELTEPEAVEEACPEEDTSSVDLRFDEAFGDEFDDLPQIDFSMQPEPTPAQEAFDFPEELDLSQEPAFSEMAGAEEAQNAPAQEEQPKEMPLPRPRQRRRRPSKMRMFKDVYLPVIIAGVAVILMLTFIIGAIVRAVKNGGDTIKDPTDPSQSQAQLLQAEADRLLKEAAALAAGYDFQGALDTLDSFSGDIANFTAMRDKRSEYATAKDQLKVWSDPASIPNLSFHVLIADPARAFADKDYGAAYNMNFVTTDEFSKILDQLYANGFVLVDLDSFIQETTADDGKTTYDSKPIYLPEGKKPIMLTETLVNYFYYMIDKDRDGEPNADGGGFASRLIVQNGEITCEMVDASGNTVTGDFDLVPILNKFIDAHPDFCYQGARAILAVSGDEGVFGYRTMPSVIEKKGQGYYNEQVEGAKKIVQALRDDGYTIACYTYENIDYNKTSATGIQADLDLWVEEVVPVLGEIDVMVYARGSDITTGGGYYGNTKYNVMKSEGFCYFLGAANVPWAEVTKDYVRQSRLMVTGSNMANTSSLYANYFDSKAVLNDLRGNDK